MKPSRKQRKLEAEKAIKRTAQPVPQKPLIIHSDGSYNKRNGQMAIGIHSENFAVGMKITHPATSPAISEYQGVLHSLKLALANKNLTPVIKCDSKNVLQELKDQRTIPNDNQRELYFQIKEFIAVNKMKPNLIWVPREQNQKADKLATTANRQKSKKQITGI